MRFWFLGPQFESGWDHFLYLYSLYYLYYLYSFYFILYIIYLISYILFSLLLCVLPILIPIHLYHFFCICTYVLYIYTFIPLYLYPYIFISIYPSIHLSIYPSILMLKTSTTAGFEPTPPEEKWFLVTRLRPLGHVVYL